MSRIGKLPISIPKGVEIKVDGSKVCAKGPKGELTCVLPGELKCEITDDTVVIVAPKDGADMRRWHGLARALVRNVIVGVSEGFSKTLELQGVGYRAAVKGNLLDLQLGFSHPTEKEIPADLSVKVEDNVRVVIHGADKRIVGQFAADVRALRPPEPYKGKGIRYLGEYVRRKQGKAAK